MSYIDYRWCQAQLGGRWGGNALADALGVELVAPEPTEGRDAR